MRLYDLATYAPYGALALGIVCAGIANANVLPDKKDAWKVFYARERGDFIDKGWKFRQAALGCCVLAFVLIPLSKMIQFFEAH